MNKTLVICFSAFIILVLAPAYVHAAMSQADVNLFNNSLASEENVVKVYEQYAQCFGSTCPSIDTVSTAETNFANQFGNALISEADKYSYRSFSELGNLIVLGLDSPGVAGLSAPGALQQYWAGMTTSNGCTQPTNLKTERKIDCSATPGTTSDYQSCYDSCTQEFDASSGTSEGNYDGCLSACHDDYTIYEALQLSQSYVNPDVACGQLWDNGNIEGYHICASNADTQDNVLEAELIGKSWEAYKAMLMTEFNYEQGPAATTVVGICSAPLPCAAGSVLSDSSNTCVPISSIIGVPSDTPCTLGWPGRQGSIVTINEPNHACDLFEVSDKDLLPIANEAVKCYSTECQDSSCNPFCAVAFAQSNACKGDTDSFKRFAGLYIIYGLGPAATIMNGYFSAQINCGINGTGSCSPKESYYNRNVQQLQCKSSVGQPKGWASDTDMSDDSCLISDLPAHADINILQTGTCVDYSVSLTTLLRQVGYSNDEVLSVTAPEHEYNLVKFPGDAKWTIVDTVGNAPAPLGDTWHWGANDDTTHCDYFYCSNDAGPMQCPDKSEVSGC